MKYLLLFVASFSGLLNQLFGQNIVKNKDIANGQAFFYYSMEPQNVNGVLILLPGSGESPKTVFDKTSLPKRLAEKGYMTIVPELHNMLFIDQSTIEEINKIIRTQFEKHKATNFIIGGLSSGGAIAVGYAEYLSARDTKNMLKGVFAIDAPLDLQRLYASAERKIKYNCRRLIVKEGYSIKSQLDNTLGGSPDVKPSQYLKASCYSAKADDGGNARYLKNIPVRLYCEPDLDFVKRTYCEDLQFDDINAFDLEGLAKFLLHIGNNKSQYIATKDRGFHSWNIVDPIECSDWILKICN